MEDVVLLEDSGGKTLEEFLLEKRHEALLSIDARGKITTGGHKFVRAVGVEPCRQMSRLKMLKHKRAYNSYKETSIKVHPSVLGPQFHCNSEGLPDVLLCPFERTNEDQQSL